MALSDWPWLRGSSRPVSPAQRAVVDSCTQVGRTWQPRGGVLHMGFLLRLWPVGGLVSKGSLRTKLAMLPPVLTVYTAPLLGVFLFELPPSPGDSKERAGSFHWGIRDL